MKHFLIILFLFVNLSYSALCSEKENPRAEKMKNTQWFTDARFGMFIHFGLYTMPGGIWKGEEQSRSMYAEWIQKQGNWPYGISDDEYRALAKEFNPVDFDADEWIRLAKQAGMKYFLLTAKHHDGFALWPSKVSDFNVVGATPFKRDILGELAKACEKYGIVLGFYYSHWQDWEHPGGGQPPIEMMLTVHSKPYPTEEAFNAYWNNKCIPQVKELMKNYKPKFWWFDTWRPAKYIDEAKLDELIKTVKDIDSECLINSRILARFPGIEKKVDYISMGDNRFPDALNTQPWETSGTMNDSWGYSKIDFAWKPTSELLTGLIKNAAHNGNYQMNVGPLANGKFPVPAIKRLKEIGAWMDVNGEAIYGAKYTSIPDPDWGYITSKTLGNGKTRLYLHVIEPQPHQEIKLKLDYFPSRNLNVYMLESGQKIDWHPVVYKGIGFDLPKHIVDKNVSVVVVDLDVNYQKKLEEVAVYSK